TPAKDGASDWRAENTVDLIETARVVEELIRAGIDGILSLGTLGECSTLTWDEKRDFMAAVVETARGRVPYFGGTTSLNTRETVRQTRAAYDLGVDGTMLGPPMWCYPDLPTTVQFYKDVAAACPDMAICVYANPEAFKFDFPRPFWAQITQVPQVVAAKIVGIATVETDLRLSKGQIRLLPVDGNYYAAARIAPEECTAFWSGGALCGPAVQIRLRDEVAAAKTSGDWSAAKALSGEIGAASARLMPNGSFPEFSKYNIGLEKARMNAAGWIKAGPCRPPYHLVPESYLEGARESGKMLAKLHARLTADTPLRTAAGR
ncbi:MAG: trans-o-hydroxybenzylidenepyruvate hydratase-aldolase, partial [Alphaproteobacteria bacterium]|nr:trans-o-hydroxybenzylidenepyruvate hydratase-aldolase [Alphaproteobacteria bacterium]